MGCRAAIVLPARRRAANLVDAINAHAGEAAQVIRNYQGSGDAAHNLNSTDRQNLLYFLRSL